MSFTVKTLLALCLLTLVAACDQSDSMEVMDEGMVMEEEPMQKM